jgi:hypothetical protein
MFFTVIFYIRKERNRGEGEGGEEGLFYEPGSIHLLFS